MKAIRGIVVVLLCVVSLASTPGASTAAAPGDQHDFDFNIGTWHTEISRLVHPLAASSTWLKMHGTVVVRKIWHGRASVEEIEADGIGGHFEGLTLFLYNPKTRRWSQNFANSNGGTLDVPTIGAFKNGRGDFYDRESFDGRPVVVRQVWSHITPDSHQFDQAFSADGGRTWQANFVAKLTRISALPRSVATHDGSHDFDFDFGTWKMETSRLRAPLSGSHDWYPMHGETVNHKIWNGRGNLAEVELDGAMGHLELLALRLYNPQSKHWSITFATSNGGTLGVPVVGGFTNKRGVFYDREEYKGKPILVRFVIYPITATTARSEQSFSSDGGKTWELNWINRYTRIAA